MKVISGLVIVGMLAGCQVSQQPKEDRGIVGSAERRNASDAARKPLLIQISSAGAITLDGWQLSESDIAGVVAERHPRSAVVRGDKFAPYRTALDLAKRLREAGVPDVRIE